MNAVISLCHFCELHGPTVLMSTQPCRSNNQDVKSNKRKFYGPPECLLSRGASMAGCCEACQSLSDNIYVSSDHESQTSYLSAQLPWQKDTELQVRQACIRSLSCEVSFGKEGVLVFSDDAGSGTTSNCSVLSHTFLVSDSLARGFHRWFSIIVLTRDRILLLNMWPFLQKNLASFISELQTAGSKVHETEQTIRPQRALRLNNAYCADKTSRPLSELTGIPHVFQKLHLWFVWLLRGAATRFRETLPINDITLPLEPYQEVEDGFTYVTAKEGNTLTKSRSLAGESSAVIRLDTKEPNIANISMLRSVLGPVDFARIVFCLLVGKQIVVRGQPPVLVASILFTLQNLLPRNCIRLVPYHTQYLLPSQCNLLGLEQWAAVPQPSASVARLEVLSHAVSDGPLTADCPMRADQHTYHLKWTGELPPRWPTFLMKLDRAMDSQLLSDSTLKYQIASLRLDTLNSAKVLRQLEAPDKRDSNDARDRAALLQALNVTPYDIEVLTFWSKGWTE